MVDASELCEQMNQVRQRGSANAQELSQEVERLSDWREHVRAYPLPLALAALSIGYFVVPQRRADLRSRIDSSDRSASASVVGSTPQIERKVASVGSLSTAAMGFVGSLVGNAVRSYISQQVHSLINPRANDATSSKW